MKIKIIKCLEDNFSYLLIDEITRSAVVIDPSEAEPVINKIESLDLKLKFIMNTHHHYDHVGGNKELKIYIMPKSSVLIRTNTEYLK